MRNLELPGRSPVNASEAMAATSHPLSSQTAIEILRAGGNALDAAVAACAVQCVVEPGSTGIGGDCFCLLAPEGSADLVAFNGSGRAPAAATPEWYAGQGITEIVRQSPHAVVMPAAIEAWHRLLVDHGRLSLREVLAPAIRYARDGYPVASRVASDFAREAAILRGDEAAAGIFLKDGAPPKVGSLQRQTALADTLEAIAEHGPEAFYAGPIAEDIVETLQAQGGLHTLQDMADVRGEYVTPISSEFRGYRVHECPPNGQGVIALLLLNIMKTFPVEGSDPITVERLHLEIEACRLAYQERNLYVADPDMAEVPVDWLLSDDHASELAQSIDPERAAQRPREAIPAHHDTVYVTVVDKDRNACSFINSLFSGFGSGITAPRSGVVLNNRGQGFVLEPGHPNCIAPGKRPLHTIIPGMVTKGDRAVMPFGVMGGHYQSFGHMQFLTRYFDFGLDIQEAMDRPRVFPDPVSGDVTAEGSLPGEVAEGLRAKGHRLVPPEKPIGGSQAIWIDWDENVLTGGSDPRKDGSAIGI